MKRRYLYFNLIILVFLIVLGNGYSQTLQHNSKVGQIAEKGTIDWEGGFLYATGVGVPPSNIISGTQGRHLAVRAATVDAQRQLLEIVKGVHLTATTTVTDLQAKDIIITKLEGYIKGVQPVQIKYFRDNSAEVTMRLPLDGRGGVASVILENAPIEIQGEDVFNMKHIDYEKRPEMSLVVIERVDKTESKLMDQILALQRRISGLEAIVAELLQERQNKSDDQSVSITGVIFDAQQRDVKPAAFPHIHSEDGKLIYGYSKKDGKLVCGNERVDSEQGVLAGWTKDIENAKLHDRAKLYPAVVEVVGTSKDNRSIFIIRKEDAQKILRFNENRKLLQSHRVVIVY